jgi:hypothetical protein
MSERILKRWTTDFHLSPEQVAKIKPILKTVETEVSGIHQENEGRMKGSFERMHQQVLPLLDQEQKRLFEEHRKKMERRANERRHGGAGNSTNSGSGNTTP